MTTNLNTVRLSGEWQATDQLKLSAEYTLSYGAVMFGQFNGVFAPPSQCDADLPERGQLTGQQLHHEHRRGVKTTYIITANMEFSLAAEYSMFDSRYYQDTTPAVVPDCLPTCGCTAAEKATVAILTPGYLSAEL